VDPPAIAEATIEELLEHLKAPEQYTRVRANRELASRPRQGLMNGLLSSKSNRTIWIILFFCSTAL
jgi:hypothetical protein